MGSSIVAFAGAQFRAAADSSSSLVSLVPRRWYSTLSLASPDAAPGLHPLLALIAALGTLLLLAAILQGPRTALAQSVDLAGFLRLVRRSAARIQRSPRLVASLIGFTVLSWTAHQALNFRMNQGREDLILLRKTRGLLELAVEQGLHCTLTPFRDLAGLADDLPLLLAAAVLLFQAGVDRSDPEPRGGGRRGFDLRSGPDRSHSTRALVLCGFASLYAVYRLSARALGFIDRPLGGLSIVEAALIPSIMLVCDAVLLSWVLVELRDPDYSTVSDRQIRGIADSACNLVVPCIVLCMCILTARYTATAALLALDQVPAGLHESGFGRYLRWQLGTGLADVQAGGMVFAGAVGAAAWSGGSIRGTMIGWFRLTASEGGRVVAVLAATAIAVGSAAAVPYLVVLMLPTQTWVLAAADGYSHYATLPVGLWGLSGLVELGCSALAKAEAALPSEPIKQNRRVGAADE